MCRGARDAGWPILGEQLVVVVWVLLYANSWSQVGLCSRLRPYLHFWNDAAFNAIDYKVWIGFLVVPGSNEVSSASFGRSLKDREANEFASLVEKSTRQGLPAFEIY
ncbi:hypothetical protein HYC85_022610 [Camellia sinensis]|uniref:Uncharacterized protein n=1 Tax=Camellia sinensis TaxID=4442 RepID=A0A7J7GEJ4_CAMSI|nr:hypothetical protein HYC85_022610 [Camellia sinensis]